MKLVLKNKNNIWHRTVNLKTGFEIIFQNLNGANALDIYGAQSYMLKNTSNRSYIVSSYIQNIIHIFYTICVPINVVSVG